MRWQSILDELDVYRIGQNGVCRALRSWVSGRRRRAGRCGRRAQVACSTAHARVHGALTFGQAAAENDVKNAASPMMTPRHPRDAHGGIPRPFRTSAHRLIVEDDAMIQTTRRKRP